MRPRFFNRGKGVLRSASPPEAT